MGKVRRSPDVRRMAHAVSHPGIDPRIWGSWAIITEVGLDPKEGLFADIQLQPTGEVETVLITGIYAGNGFGCYRPLKKDDTVFILFPNGDPSNGGIVVARSWNAADPTPPQFDSGNGEDPIDHPMEVVEKDKKWTVITSGSGDTELFTDHNVLIGDANAAPVIPSNWASDPAKGLVKALTTLAGVLTTAGIANTLANDLTALPPVATTKGKIT